MPVLPSPHPAYHTGLIPFVFGVTGKMSLFEPAAHAQAAAIADGLLAFFKELHRQDIGAATPKFLLTSLAPGADYIAAWAAMKANEALPAEAAGRFRLLCPLPFERAVYEQDFVGVMAEHRTLLAALTAPQPVLHDWWRGRAATALNCPAEDVLIFSLPPLFGAVPAAMDRYADGRSGPDRTIHYEQAGLWVADRCHTLLYIAEAEDRPNRIGGSARIAFAKRRGYLPGDTDIGRPGRLAEDIGRLERSADRLAGPNSLAGDPLESRLRRLSQVLGHRHGPRPPEPGFTLDIWAPATSAAETAAGGTGPALMAGVNGSERGPYPLCLPDSIARTLRGLDGYNRHLREPGGKAGDRADKVKADFSKGSGNMPLHIAALDAAFLAAAREERSRHASDPRLIPLLIRRHMADIQAGFDARSGWLFQTFAWLFVASVTCFTIAAKIFSDQPLGAFIALLCYFILMGVAGCLHLGERDMRIGQRRHDYRAVAEGLRVQTYWMLGGLDERVEDCYGLGSGDVLSYIRRCLRSANLMTEIACIRATGSPVIPATELRHVVEQDWILDQIGYFRKASTRKLAQAHHRLIRIRASLMGSLGLAVALLALLFAKLVGPTHGHTSHAIGLAWLPLLDLAVTAGFAAVFHLLTRAIAGLLSDRPSHAGHVVERENKYQCGTIPAKTGGALAFIRSIASHGLAVAIRRPIKPSALRLFGIPALAGLALGLSLPAILSLVVSLTGQDNQLVVHLAKIAISCNVVMGLAWTGAQIFLFEKLGEEAEARNYQEMAAVFEAHLSLYRAALDPGQRREVLRALGRIALEENAAWLRSRHDHPLEPLTGA